MSAQTAAELRVVGDVLAERARQDEKWGAVFGHIEVPRDDDSCWDWTGNCDRDGYGIKTVNGRQWRVNRLSYELATGKELGALHARHTCDRPVCFRPSHLIPGTNLDNVADKVERGRARNQYTDADRCIYGHPFTENNVYVNPTSGARQCRTCRRELNRLEKRLAGCPAPVRKVLREVFRERMRQESIFGEQNHPDGTGPEVWWTRHLGPAHVVRDTYRDLTDAHASGVDGPVTWLDILREEIGEAFAEDDPAKLRTELVQVAAVAVSWVQAIDRRDGAR